MFRHVVRINADKPLKPKLAIIISSFLTLEFEGQDLNFETICTLEPVSL